MEVIKPKRGPVHKFRSLHHDLLSFKRADFEVVDVEKLTDEAACPTCFPDGKLPSPR